VIFEIRLPEVLSVILAGGWVNGVGECSRDQSRYKPAASKYSIRVICIHLKQQQQTPRPTSTPSVWVHSIASASKHLIRATVLQGSEYYVGLGSILPLKGPCAATDIWMNTRRRYTWKIMPNISCHATLQPLKTVIMLLLLNFCTLCTSRRFFSSLFAVDINFIVPSSKLLAFAFFLEILEIFLCLLLFLHLKVIFLLYVHKLQILYAKMLTYLVNIWLCLS
jgi:hypothetical protein